MTDDTAEPFEDEPVEPHHPDYERLLEAGAWMDAEAEPDDFDPGELLGRYVDVDSFLATVAGRTYAQLDRPLTPSEFASYMDGAMLALRFAELGGHRER